MISFNPVIRNTVRAVIVRDNRILLLRKEDELRGERFSLPGGAQEAGETLKQAVNRECQEEINTEVKIGDLLHIADFFKQRKLPEPHIRHQVELLFECSVPNTYIPGNGSHPDKHQVEVVWKDLTKLTELNLKPFCFAALLAERKRNVSPIYLGTVD